MYWTGAGEVDTGTQQARAAWLPKNMDHIPLQEWNPANEGQVMATSEEEDSVQ